MAYMEEPVFEFQGFKRAGNACPAAYSLCSSQLGGGCCPSTLSCGTSSCYGTMTSPTAACSSTGYVTCGVQEGGGCCPSGYQCDRNGCVAPTQTSVSTAVASCATGSSLCPASLNYGCCADGLSCGLTTCYATSASTVSWTLTITTTNSVSSVSTLTTVVQTVYVPSIPTQIATTFTPVAVSKIAASTTIGPAKSTSTSSVGLTGSQRGGIIGGAVAGLLVVMLLAFMVIIVLRRFSKAIPQASRNNDGPPSHPDHNYTRQMTDNPSEPLVNMYEVPGKSVDPPTAVHTTGKLWTTYISPQNSPPFYSSNAIGYTPLPESESDFQNPHTNHAFGYFDHIPRSSGTYVSPPVDTRERSISLGQSSEARRPSVTSHGRQWSDVSVQSHRSNHSNESYELEARGAERHGSLHQTLADWKVVLSGKRSRRKGSLSTRGTMDTVEWAKSLQVTLDNVVEGQRPEDGNYEESQGSQRTTNR